MGRLIASAIEIPGLACAAAARGLRLVPIAEAFPECDSAALLESANEDPAQSVARARARGWTGPLMLALAKGGANGVARALDAGADDAIVLPANPGEIAARLAARLRASGAAPIVIGELRIDPISRRVTRAGQALALLPREYALLMCLARRNGVYVSRAELLAMVWRLSFDPGTNVVQVHVSRLRAKLDRGFGAPMLLNEKGRGYCLTSPAI